MAGRMVTTMIAVIIIVNLIMLLIIITKGLVVQRWKTAAMVCRRMINKIGLINNPLLYLNSMASTMFKMMKIKVVTVLIIFTTMITVTMRKRLVVKILKTAKIVWKI